MEHASVLIYIHGFLSSPQSQKAQDTSDYLHGHYPDTRFIVPELDNLPGAAALQLIGLIESLAPAKPALIGSSLGGFYAAWLSANYNLKSVLVNPVIYKPTILTRYLGENYNPHTHQRFNLNQAHLDLLDEMNTLVPRQKDLFMLLQTGDETLNYRDALLKYPHAKTLVEQGGNHRFKGYKKHLPAIMKFLEI